MAYTKEGLMPNFEGDALPCIRVMAFCSKKKEKKKKKKKRKETDFHIKMDSNG